MSDAPNAYVTPARCFLLPYLGRRRSGAFICQAHQAVYGNKHTIGLMSRRLCASSVGLIAAFTTFYPLILASRHLHGNAIYILLFVNTYNYCFWQKDVAALLAGFYGGSNLTRPMVFILAPLPYICNFSKEPFWAKQLSNLEYFFWEPQF